MALCYCGSGIDFKKCCEPYLSGTAVPTAEALMRSRYTAYVIGDMDHIEKTSTPKALKGFDRADSQSYSETMKWEGLEILSTTDGQEGDETGRVEFVFRGTYNNEPHVQHELSDFCRIDGKWMYDDSIINPKSEPVRTEKIGRNDPCPCGSGKKYKKCCNK